MAFHNNRGFVQAIVIIVIILIILGFLGYNITDILKKPAVQNNLSWAWSMVKLTWNNFLEKPTMYLVNLFWKGLGHTASTTASSLIK